MLRMLRVITLTFQYIFISWWFYFITKWGEMFLGGNNDGVCVRSQQAYRAEDVPFHLVVLAYEWEKFKLLLTLNIAGHCRQRNYFILFDNHTTCFDHKCSSSGVTIHIHIYQTATLTFTFTYTYLSSAYNSFVSGFVGNIHPITQVKIECKLSHSLFKFV
jgi:hypothetical protein